ncbi:MAG: hypothetical protein P8123_08120, partial [bacterium]
PVATKSMYITCIPFIGFLLAAYYVLWHFSPNIIKGLSPLMVIISCLLVIGRDVMSLCFSRDEHGKRIPYSKRIAQLQAAYDYHDYAYFLIDHGGKTVQELNLQKEVVPQAIQNVIRTRYSAAMPHDAIEFHVQNLEEIQLEFYPKDGDPNNQIPLNRGVRILKGAGKKEKLRVLFIPVNPRHAKQELAIPTSLVESYAEEYISSQSDQAKLTFQKVLSYAINQAVVKRASRAIVA